MKKRWPYVLGSLVMLLGGAVFLALHRLDSLLLERARAEASALGGKLGRSVEVGDVSTRLWPNLGARVTGVAVGPAEGEELPLVRLGRVEVDVALKPLWDSRGKDVRVTNAEVSELTVNVLRLADGTTNLSRLLERLDSEEPAAEPEPADTAAEPPPRDWSFVHVERVALTDGTFRFVDKGGTQARELAISDVDVEVKDLRVGKPLEVSLAAAVLAEKQNLHVKVRTAPLPATLVPVVPERLELKAEPMDLAPLGPFLPPDVGLQAGTVQADWTVELGTAVAGGMGPTRLKGGLQAKGLRFAGAGGGKALDVVLETDVTADVATGDVVLGALELGLGPAHVSGKGQVKGLRSEKPGVEGFELLARGLDPAVLAEYYPPLKKQLGGRLAGPIGLVVRGSGTQEAQALMAQVDLTPVRLRIPEQLTKEPGAPLRLTARLTGAAASGGALRFDTQADLSGVDLRPGEVLDKAPGQRLEVTAAGTYQPARGKEPMKVELGTLKVGAREDTLTGKASFAVGGKTTSLRLALAGPRLDADALMLSDAEVEAFSGRVPEPSTNPRRFDGLRGDVRLEVGTLRYKEMDLSRVLAEVKLVDDTVKVEKFTTGVYGGTVTADGSSARLGPLPPERPFEAKLQVRGLDVARAVASVSTKQVMKGTFNGDVDLKGVGFDMDKLKESLVGAIQGDVEGGTLLGLDMVAAVTGPLAKALPFAAKALESGKVTDLGESLPFSVQIQDGMARLKKPVTWTRPDTALKLDGGIRLDGTLALAGAMTLQPSLVQKLTQGRVVPRQPLPVALKLTGKAWAPEVTELDLKPVVAELVRLAASGAASKLLGEKGKVVDQVLSGGVEEAKRKAQAEADTKRRELEAKAAAEKAKLEQKAREESERARKRAEEEAKKRLQGLFGR